MRPDDFHGDLGADCPPAAARHRTRPDAFQSSWTELDGVAIAHHLVNLEVVTRERGAHFPNDRLEVPYGNVPGGSR